MFSVHKPSPLLIPPLTQVMTRRSNLLKYLSANCLPKMSQTACLLGEPLINCKLLERAKAILHTGPPLLSEVCLSSVLCISSSSLVLSLSPDRQPSRNLHKLTQWYHFIKFPLLRMSVAAASEQDKKEACGGMAPWHPSVLNGNQMFPYKEKENRLGKQNILKTDQRHRNGISPEQRIFAWNSQV